MQFLQFTTVVSCWVASLQLQVQTFSVFYIFIKRKDLNNISCFTPTTHRKPLVNHTTEISCGHKMDMLYKLGVLFHFSKKVQQHVEGNCQNKTKGSN